MLARFARVFRMIPFIALAMLFIGCGSGGSGTSGTSQSSSGSTSSSGSSTSSSSSSSSGANAPRIADCQIFPDDNFWNTAIDDPAQYPVHPNSAAYISSIGAGTRLHPDFGTEWEGSDIGIPFDVIPANQPLVPITFDYYDESDMGSSSCNPGNDPTIGCYPIPANPSIEGGSDQHILLLQQGTCILYEIFAAEKDSGGHWFGGSGAIWHLDQNEVRPDGWTSADASGLAILPGLVRYDEVFGSGEINHAFRITLSTIRNGYVWPATHSDGRGGDDARYPLMGQRLRLKEGYEISGFSAPTQKILRAMKKYGVVVADTGSDMFVTGQHHDGWTSEKLEVLIEELNNVHADAFEAIDITKMIPSH